MDIDLRMGAEIATALLTISGSWWAMNGRVKTATDKATAAHKASVDVRTTVTAAVEALTERFDEHEAALRKRLEDQDRRITVTETTQRLRDEETQRALYRIEATLSAGQTRTETAIGEVHRRLDEALKERQ